MANCVVRHTHVCPEISNRSIEEHVTFSVFHFCDLLQCIVVTFQRPDEIRLFRVGDRRADHVVLSLESFFLYVAFGFNCMKNVPTLLNRCKRETEKLRSSDKRAYNIMPKRKIRKIRLVHLCIFQ